MKVKTGDKLIYPIHGELTVTNENASEYEEYINDIKRIKTV